MSEHFVECPLCRLVHQREILTPLYYEDERFIVVDCIICRTPMLVLKAHHKDFSEEERVLVRQVFRQLVVQLEEPILINPIYSHLMSQEMRWIIDWEQRRIPDHPHCHLRPFPFPASRHWEYLIALK